MAAVLVGIALVFMIDSYLWMTIDNVPSNGILSYELRFERADRIIRYESNVMPYCLLILGMVSFFASAMGANRYLCVSTVLVWILGFILVFVGVQFYSGLDGMNINSYFLPGKCGYYPTLFILFLILTRAGHLVNRKCSYFELAPLFSVGLMCIGLYYYYHSTMPGMNIMSILAPIRGVIALSCVIIFITKKEDIAKATLSWMLIYFLPIVVMIFTNAFAWENRFDYTVLDYLASIFALFSVPWYAFLTYISFALLIIGTVFYDQIE